MKMFADWCTLKGAQPFPAAPKDVATFVSEIAPLGIDKVWEAVGEISRAHYLQGLADPTLGGWVASAINDIAKVELPRSWPPERKASFARLPYDLQVYLSEREATRDKEVRRAQNETAAAKQQLAEHLKPASPVATILEQSSHGDQPISAN